MSIANDSRESIRANRFARIALRIAHATKDAVSMLRGSGCSGSFCPQLGRRARQEPVPNEPREEEPPAFGPEAPKAVGEHPRVVVGTLAIASASYRKEKPQIPENRKRNLQRIGNRGKMGAK